ncbi:FliM/FliN family flagellar motor C-terminal domain-containing protein [Comamonas odontotermitis]|uniref:FliM/FliN family flagellar motor switch protein n=1 Tax=Comamonas odontotermitis TaxID=379895 RepID=UPI00367102A9
MKSQVSPSTFESLSSVLLPLDTSHIQVQELRAWRKAERASLCKIFDRAYQQWRTEWGLPIGSHNTESQVQIADAFTDHAASSISPPDSLALLLFKEPVDIHAESSMAAQLIHQAWNAWLERLEALTGKSLAEPSHTMTSTQPPRNPWSGELLVSFPMGEETWKLAISASVVEGMLTQHQVKPFSRGTEVSQRPLVPLAQALRNHRLKVRVELDGATLSLGQLQTLAPGDIVALGHLLDQPARLALELPAQRNYSAPLCFAWLGQTQGQIAIQLSPQVSLKP